MIANVPIQAGLDDRIPRLRKESSIKGIKKIHELKYLPISMCISSSFERGHLMTS